MTGSKDLQVTADLQVHVTAPDGRSTAVRLSDRDGTLVVDVTSLKDLRVLAASVPGPTVLRRTALPGPGVTGADAFPLDRFGQDVEVAVGGKVLARRVAGSWAPGRQTVLAVVTVVAVVVAIKIAVIAAVVARRRHRRG